MILSISRLLVLVIVITVTEVVKSQDTIEYTYRRAIEVEEGLYEAFPSQLGEISLYPVIETIVEKGGDTIVLTGNILFHGNSQATDIIAICKPMKWSIRSIICSEERYKFVRFGDKNENGKFEAQVRLGKEVIVFCNYRMNSCIIFIPISVH